MKAPRRVAITALFTVLVVTTISRADLLPLRDPDATSSLLTQEGGLGPQHSDLLGLFAYPRAEGGGNLPGEFLSKQLVSDEESPNTQVVQILVDRQNSATLCLYALLGLGLFKSAPWVKQISLGVVPGWYHDGGPFQVGHSHAIGPDLCSAAMVCFVQPDCVTQDFLPQYFRATVASLLRKSLFTPNVIAPRGPPSIS